MGGLNPPSSPSISDYGYNRGFIVQQLVGLLIINGTVTKEAVVYFGVFLV
jgi:hypothetical protein